MEDTYDILMHYGILGMKWGIRRTPEELGHKSIKSMKRKSFEKTDLSIDVKLVNKGNDPSNQKNCGQCVVALELRQRGYDVEAIDTKESLGDRTLKRMFKGFETKDNFDIRIKPTKRTETDWNEYKKFVESNIQKLSTELKKEGPNARGFLTYYFDDSEPGHAVMWATDSSGKVSFYDGQSGKSSLKDGIDSLSMYASNQYYWWGRLDNLELDDSVTEAVRNRKG